MNTESIIGIIVGLFKGLAEMWKTLKGRSEPRKYVVIDENKKAQSSGLDDQQRSDLGLSPRRHRTD